MAEPGNWTERAACRGADPALWYPEKGQNDGTARAICHTCPVQTECLAWAVTNGERFGVWGGVSERGRRRLRVAQRTEAA